jgi:hypothetical protein
MKTEPIILSGARCDSHLQLSIYGAMSNEIRFDNSRPVSRHIMEYGNLLNQLTDYLKK